MAPSFFELPVNNSREAIIENIRANCKRGLPELRQHGWSPFPLAIVAGGPSVHDYLPYLKSIRSSCHVLAVNGAYKFLRSHGIEPEHFLLIDSRRENLTHVDAPSEGTNHCLASQVHPAVFEALRDHAVTMFHLGTETNREAVPGAFSYLAAPVGMASVHAVYVGAALGYRQQLLFGYDFSSRPGEAYAYEQPLNAKDEYLEINLDGQTYRTTLALARTAEQFIRAVSPVIRACELDLQLCSDGLLSAIIRKASEPVTEESERAKYEEIWQLDDYRKVSPGLESVDEALEHLKIPGVATLADFGCGTGRCVSRFRQLGVDAVGVDIARNALEEDVPFVLAALWDAEKLPRVDYGFSVDVLEHIPTDRVDATLEAIRGAVRHGCYFNIDTIPDSFGVRIGKTLHLTVQPAEWWEQKLKALWPRVTRLNDDPRQAVFICNQ